MKFNTLIPELTVLNVEVSLNFYTKITSILKNHHQKTTVYFLK